MNSNQENQQSDERLLIEEYKIRVTHINKHYDRLWRRFHFFLLINLALIAYDGSLKGLYGMISKIGIGFSILWLIISFQDRQLVVRYKKGIKDILSLIDGRLLSLSPFISANEAGHTDKYIQFLSVTKLPGLTSVLFISIWTFILITSKI